jgi:hypothetical protein
MKIARNEGLAPRGIVLVLALLATVHSGVARAGEAAKHWQPVEDAAMAGLTGGFQGSDGVTVAFAIDVEGLVNGIPVMQKSVTGGPLTLTAGSPQSVAAALTSYSKVMTLILKNNADRQSLQMRTVLNVSLTELTAVRALQTQSLVSSWQANAFRP